MSDKHRPAKPNLDAQKLKRGALTRAAILAHGRVRYEDRQQLILGGVLAMCLGGGIAAFF
jgi:hypothetical protein